jgi:hypothetical protein
VTTPALLSVVLPDVEDHARAFAWLCEHSGTEARGAVDGLLRLTLDLQHLVQDPAILWGFAWDPTGHLRIDGPRLRDADAIAARSGRAARVWLADARRWFDEAPVRAAVARIAAHIATERRLTGR